MTFTGIRRPPLGRIRITGLNGSVLSDDQVQAIVQSPRSCGTTPIRRNPGSLKGSAADRHARQAAAKIAAETRA